MTDDMPDNGRYSFLGKIGEYMEAGSCSECAATLGWDYRRGRRFCPSCDWCSDSVYCYVCEQDCVSDGNSLVCPSCRLDIPAVLKHYWLKAEAGGWGECFECGSKELSLNTFNGVLGCGACGWGSEEAYCSKCMATFVMREDVDSEANRQKNAEAHYCDDTALCSAGCTRVY